MPLPVVRPQTGSRSSVRDSQHLLSVSVPATSAMMSLFGLRSTRKAS
jgi:hypothetical protein